MTIKFQTNLQNSYGVIRSATYLMNFIGKKTDKTFPGKKKTFNRKSGMDHGGDYRKQYDEKLCERTEILIRRGAKGFF